MMTVWLNYMNRLLYKVSFKKSLAPSSGTVQSLSVRACACVCARTHTSCLLVLRNSVCRAWPGLRSMKAAGPRVQYVFFKWKNKGGKASGSCAPVWTRQPGRPPGSCQLRAARLPLPCDVMETSIRLWTRHGWEQPADRQTDRQRAAVCHAALAHRGSLQCTQYVYCVCPLVPSVSLLISPELVNS